MRIDAKLNIVIEVETADGSVFVHSTPLSRDVFERYFLVIGQTFAELVGKGLSLLSGPRVAALLLKDVAQRGRVWDGPGGVANGLMAEVRRLSNVIMPGPAGWRTVPLQDAIDKQLLSEDDIAEVEGLIVFFICVSAMSRKSEIAPVLEQMALWGVRTTSLNCTEWLGFWRTSTETATGTAAASTASVPS